MGEEKPGGCLQVGCSLWIIGSIITLFIFFVSNNSIDKVQELSLDDISYHLYMPANWSYMPKDQYENKHKYILSILEKDDINTDDELKDMLDDNKYLQNTSYSKSNMSGADIITINTQLKGSNSPTSFEFNFIIKPKSLMRQNLTEFIGVYEVKITSGGKSFTLDDPDKILSLFALLSSSDKTENYVKKQEMKMYDFDRTIESYGGR